MTASEQQLKAAQAANRDIATAFLAGNKARADQLRTERDRQSQRPGGTR